MPAPLPNALSRGMARHALTPAEQAPLWREYRRRPTPELRQRLALANLRLVAAVAGGWKGPPDHDAFQAGVEGLLLAVEKYEPKRGTTFGTCALWWIRASITRRQAQPGLQVSGAAISKASKVTKAREHLARQLGRTPSETELAAWLELPAPKVAQALDAARARRRHTSLSKPIGDEEGGATLADVLAGQGDPEQDLAQAEETRETILRVRDAVARVADRRLRHVFASHYLNEEQFGDIGARLGVTRQRAYQLALKAKGRVEEHLRAMPRRLSPRRRRMLLNRWPAIVALEGPELVQPEAA
jgi:RNA polymerase sigma factor (sigma-70 family)